MRSTRRALLALVLVTPLAARAASDPKQPVEALDQGLIAVMKAGRAASFAERSRMLTPVVKDAFDLQRILHSSIGPRFTSFPADVQARLLDVFTQFTVASYVANFDQYQGERFEVLPQTRKSGADQVVQTRLLQPGSDPVKLDYVMHNEGNAWKIVDVLMNGSISRVAVQRSDFRALLGKGGADALITSLRGKVDRLASGETVG